MSILFGGGLFNFTNPNNITISCAHYSALNPQYLTIRDIIGVSIARRSQNFLEKKQYMAVSISYWLAYSQSYIKQHRLQDQFVSIRAKIRFTLDNTHWTAKTPVIEKQFTTGIQVIPRHFKGRCQPQHPNSAQINHRLDEIAERCHTIHSKYVASGVFPPTQEFINEILNIKTAIQHGSFWNDYDRYIQFLKDKGTSLSFIKHQELIRQRLKLWQDQTRTTVRYETLTQTWSASFVKFIADLPRNTSTRTSEQTGFIHLRGLNHFLNHAKKENWTTFRTFTIKESQAVRRNAFPTTLTLDEIQKLLSITPDQIKPGEPKRVMASIDWFILATQTGLRFSDWRPDDIVIHENNIRIYQAKTKEPLEIPLSKIALSILERNDYKMPKPTVASATIRHIVAATKMLGINKKITTHTARRTFATLQELSGVPRSVIMRVTGHKTEKDYLKYIGISFHKNAEMLRKANPDWYGDD